MRSHTPALFGEHLRTFTRFQTGRFSLLTFITVIMDQFRPLFDFDCISDVLLISSVIGMKRDSLRRASSSRARSVFFLDEIRPQFAVGHRADMEAIHTIRPLLRIPGRTARRSHGAHRPPLFAHHFAASPYARGARLLAWLVRDAPRGPAWRSTFAST